MKAKKPIGKTITAICELAQRERTPISYRDVLNDQPRLDRQSAPIYLGRAVSYGLLTVDATRRPRLYSLVPDWRSLAAMDTDERQRLVEGREYWRRHGGSTGSAFEGVA